MATLESRVQQATEAARAHLRAHGIDDSITVKVKETREDWSALYRALSQFGSGPIFWISRRLPVHLKENGLDDAHLEEVACGLILHEYGHVLAEYANKRDDALEALIVGTFGNDEELFAEAFAMHLLGKSQDARIPPVLDRFKALLTTERAA